MQKTITFPSEVSGMAINGSCQSTVMFEPAKPDTGIVFIRNDLLEKPEVECLPNYAFVNKRWSSLMKDGVYIEHTEHVLAAIAALEITNIRIHLNCPYLPVISDFSSWGFMQALLEAVPITQTAPKKFIAVKEPLWVLDSFETKGGNRYDSLLLGLPSTNFSITYLLNYPDKEIPTQLAHFSTAKDDQSLSEFAKARSFILDSEYDSMMQLFGENIKKCLMIPSDKTKLRWSNEIARHKVLDLVGDLMLLGKPIKGHFIGFRSGHSANIDMVRLLNR
ncbi:UDP-3-O-acyl-N-acetylglucosamine deacetylase [Heyndrickxia vini]|uniref:UDP-3-O-acyl-N-acetylglucosamine deacetylase n=1 Tax=Heyndrickxia vini TaxID=1476025 RepID=A0ABX7DYK3_9BACI|nr:UDP-3-O-acyl-N-acetylglucosamine deacetylase [Heyndrickxia vini]QQZ08188.1 UDP-3-O-acyl-N-acetylglucosamine deacetylase [Heyndrickxia vini]